MSHAILVKDGATFTSMGFSEKPKRNRSLLSESLFSIHRAFGTKSFVADGRHSTRGNPKVIKLVLLIMDTKACV